MSFLPFYEFNKCVERYNGNAKVKTFSCRDHFYVMCFAQLTYRDSLRDIESCLKALAPKLYHSGIRHAVPKSTLAEANENRDWRIYADFAQILIKQAQQLYRPDGENDFIKDINNISYALDSTTIDLCLSVFPWAKFRSTKAAVKLHTLLDLRGSVPVYIKITEGSSADVNILASLLYEPGAIYIMDKGYTYFKMLYKIHLARSYYVTRAKVNMAFRRVYSRQVDKTTGLICDQSIKLTSYQIKKVYPELLRRVKYLDKETGKTYVFITNNFELEALQIAHLYKYRWKIELFFKWIKQHLKIKSFYGTSPNAVYCQIWIAISTYLLVAIAKKKLKLEQNPYTLLQILSLSLFEKTPINELLTINKRTNIEEAKYNQLKIF